LGLIALIRREGSAAKVSIYLKVIRSLHHYFGDILLNGLFMDTFSDQSPQQPRPPGCSFSTSSDLKSPKHEAKVADLSGDKPLEFISAEPSKSQPLKALDVSRKLKTTSAVFKKKIMRRTLSLLQTKGDNPRSK